MKDPTISVRKMYVSGLASLFPVYDGMAPTTASGLYGVITATSFIRRPIKEVNSFDFKVTLEIYQEFNEYGSSKGVDNAANGALLVLIPDNWRNNLPIDGYSHDEVVLDSGANDTGSIKAFSVWRKTLVINHVICEE